MELKKFFPFALSGALLLAGCSKDNKVNPKPDPTPDPDPDKPKLECNNGEYTLRGSTNDYTGEVEILTVGADETEVNITSLFENLNTKAVSVIQYCHLYQKSLSVKNSTLDIKRVQDKAVKNNTVRIFKCKKSSSALSDSISKVGVKRIAFAVGDTSCLQNSTYSEGYDKFTKLDTIGGFPTLYVESEYTILKEGKTDAYDTLYAYCIVNLPTIEDVLTYLETKLPFNYDKLFGKGSDKGALGILGDSITIDTIFKWGKASAFTTISGTFAKNDADGRAVIKLKKSEKSSTFAGIDTVVVGFGNLKLKNSNGFVKIDSFRKAMDSAVYAEPQKKAKLIEQIDKYDSVASGHNNGSVIDTIPVKLDTIFLNYGDGSGKIVVTIDTIYTLPDKLDSKLCPKYNQYANAQFKGWKKGDKDATGKIIVKKGDIYTAQWTGTKAGDASKAEQIGEDWVCKWALPIDFLEKYKGAEKIKAGLMSTKNNKYIYSDEVGVEIVK